MWEEDERAIRTHGGAHRVAMMGADMGRALRVQDLRAGGEAARALARTREGAQGETFSHAGLVGGGDERRACARAPEIGVCLPCGKVKHE